MPELPEVEVIRRGLRAEVRGARIADVEVRETRLRRRVRPSALLALAGRRIADVGRRAKYLLVALEDGGGIVLHLGMSGQVLLLPCGSPLDPHDHVRIWLRDNGSGSRELRFRDPRRFGLVLACTRGSPAGHPVLRGVGPEPHSPAFNADYLREVAAGSRRPIKNLLMDGRVVAGVGNIYSSEALWAAHVNPRTRSSRVSRRRWGRIRDALRDVLDAAIAEGGTTLSDFRSATGDSGYFQVSLQVYDRAGRPCRRCGARIRRIVQAGRSTFYCPRCQH